MVRPARTARAAQSSLMRRIFLGRPDTYSDQEEEVRDLQMLEAGMADAVAGKNLVMKIGEEGGWKGSRYVRGEDQSEAITTVKTV